MTANQGTGRSFGDYAVRLWGWWLPAAVLLTWIGLAVTSPWLPFAPNDVELPRILVGPSFGDSLRDWMGYDALGRPVLDRLIAGCQTSALVSVTVVAVALTIGMSVGAISGYVGGTFDHVVVRIIDIFLAFPGILLAIALAGILGPGLDNVVIALAAVGWVGFARLARAQTLSLKQQTHVLAARALGVGPARIVRVHILGNITASLIVEATFGIAAAVIAEAGLSFLGLGVQPPAASWGTMLHEGTLYMLVAPHLVLAPALAIFAVALSVNLLGDRVRDSLDVRNAPRDH